MKRSQIALLRRLIRDEPSICSSCRHTRTLHTTQRILRPSNTPAPSSKDTSTLPPSSLPKPVLMRKPDLTNPDTLSKGDTFTPKPLTRPIGFPFPPLPTDNYPGDLRSIKQRRDDFVNYDMHLQKRSQMFKEIARPYFRDFTNMRYEKGKIFKSNERLWRGNVSLWFPNVWGWDLKQGNEEACTAEMLGRGRERGKVTLVAVFSRTWAEQQINTFADPQVTQLIGDNADVAQMLEINVEETKLSRSLIWLFASNLRKKRAEEWRHYLVAKHIPHNVRENLGMLNQKAGSVFLLDAEGKIRWAGSGDAWPGEKEALAYGLNKLIAKRMEELASGPSEKVQTDSSAARLREAESMSAAA